MTREHRAYKKHKLRKLGARGEHRTCFNLERLSGLKGQKNSTATCDLGEPKGPWVNELDLEKWTIPKNPCANWMNAVDESQPRVLPTSRPGKTHPRGSWMKLKGRGTPMDEKRSNPVDRMDDK